MHKAIETTDSLRSSLEAKDARIAPALRAREQAVLMDLRSKITSAWSVVRDLAPGRPCGVTWRSCTVARACRQPSSS